MPKHPEFYGFMFIVFILPCLFWSKQLGVQDPAMLVVNTIIALTAVYVSVNWKSSTKYQQQLEMNKAISIAIFHLTNVEVELESLRNEIKLKKMVDGALRDKAMLERTSDALDIVKKETENAISSILPYAYLSRPIEAYENLKQTLYKHRELFFLVKRYLSEFDDKPIDRSKMSEIFNELIEPYLTAIKSCKTKFEGLITF